MYHKGCESIGEMTDISVKDRAVLEETCKFTFMDIADVRRSKLDGSVKVLFKLEDGEHIESVILNDGRRYTACISSQVGCRMGCTFCSTAQLGGLKRNLTAGEIIKQVKRLNELLAEDGNKLNNLVFMGGMGEPLDNLDNVKSASQSFWMITATAFLTEKSLCPHAVLPTESRSCSLWIPPPLIWRCLSTLHLRRTGSKQCLYQINILSMS